jgi:hypothetical protein
MRTSVAYEETFVQMRRAVKYWKKGSDYQIYYSTQFYSAVRMAGNINTPYMTLRAASQKKKTADHCFAPRLVFRAVMDTCPELLLDRECFDHLCEFSRHVVSVTRKENNVVKYKHNDMGLPIIRQLTRDKYDQFTWVEKGRGRLQENVNGKLVDSPFPLKDMIPDWFTEFEMKCMKEQGYL